MPKRRHRVSRLGEYGVAFYDVGSICTAVCALKAEIKPSGGIRIVPIHGEVYSVGHDAGERSDELVRVFREEHTFLGEMNRIAVEQQYPVARPDWKKETGEEVNHARRAAIERARAGNIKAYGISCAMIGALKMAYPDAEVVSASPRKRFGVLGIHRPKSKPRRKTRIRTFTYEWLMAHAHKKRWRRLCALFCSLEKADDFSDAFTGALAELFEAIAADIDVRRIRSMVGGAGKRS